MTNTAVSGGGGYEFGSFGVTMHNGATFEVTDDANTRFLDRMTHLLDDSVGIGVGIGVDDDLMALQLVVSARLA